MRFPRSAAAMVCATALLAAAACGRALPESTVSRFNAAQEARAALARPYQDQASPEFLAHFALSARLRRTLADDESGPRELPTACAVGGAGEVYLAFPSSHTLYVWRAGENRLRTLPVAPEETPREPAALAWSASDGTLAVFDAGRQQVRSYTPTGTLRGYAPLNSGQSVFSLAVLRHGRILTGGIRGETDDQVSLLALHDREGRLLRAFGPIDPVAAQSKLHVAPPVLIAPTADGGFLAAQPTSPRIAQFDPDGHELRAFGAPHAGYRAPYALPDSVLDPDRAEAWRRSWDALVFLHQGYTHTFAAFEAPRRGRRAHDLEVYAADGAMEAGGLLHDSLPLCGAGEELVFVAVGDRRTLDVSRYRYTGGAQDRTLPPHKAR